MKSFIGANVYLEGQGFQICDLSFDTHTRSVDAAPADTEVISLPVGCMVAPGFIDTHIHGAGGADTMDGSSDALATMADTLVREGTTAFLATTMTQSEANTKAALAAVATYIKEEHTNGARLLGAHMEGPYLSSEYAGAQPREHLQAPSVTSFDAYYRAADGCVKLLTIAPELSDADKLISHLASLGIAVSVGHSDAGSADIEHAIAAGLTRVTHTFNAQRPCHHREIGVAGSAMLYHDLHCELIADGIHVSSPAMKLLLHTKGKDHITLITDAMRAKGLSDCESELGGQTVSVKGGEARLADGTLAGSVARMNDMVKNMVQKVGMSVTDAIDCATINPARALKTDHEYGSICVGKRADYTVLDSDFGVVMTIRDGEIVYSRD